MAATSSVFTIGRVAEMLGEEEDWLGDIAAEMDPEDGRLIVWGPNDTETAAFPHDGIENLRQLVIEHRKLSAAKDYYVETHRAAVLAGCVRRTYTKV